MSTWQTAAFALSNVALAFGTYALAFVALPALAEDRREARALAAETRALVEEVRKAEADMAGARREALADQARLGYEQRRMLDRLRRAAPDGGE